MPASSTKSRQCVSKLSPMEKARKALAFQHQHVPAVLLQQRRADGAGRARANDDDITLFQFLFLNA